MKDATASFIVFITHKKHQLMTRIFKRVKISAAIVSIALTQCLASCSGSSQESTPLSEESTSAPEEQKVVVMKYGLPIEDFDVVYDTIRPKQTIADVLYRFGFNANQIHKLTQCPDSVFNVRKIRP